MGMSHFIQVSEKRVLMMGIWIWVKDRAFLELGKATVKEAQPVVECMD